MLFFNLYKSYNYLVSLVLCYKPTGGRPLAALKADQKQQEQGSR